MAPSLLRSLNLATVQIVAALFIQTCYVIGNVKSIGIFFPELKDTLGTTSADLGISLGLFNAFTFGPGPIVVHLFRRTGLKRPLLIAGSVLAPMGLIVSSAVSSNAQFAVCMTLGGLGANVLSQCLVICLDEHAHDHFHTLFGVGKSGYAFGMLISPLLGAFLTDLYGWRGAMLILGALTCHLVPLVVMVNTNVQGNKYHVETSEKGELSKLTDEKQVANDWICNESTEFVKGAGSDKVDDPLASQSDNNSAHEPKLEQYSSDDYLQDTPLCLDKDAMCSKYDMNKAKRETDGRNADELFSLIEIDKSLQIEHRRHYLPEVNKSCVQREMPSTEASETLFGNMCQIISNSVYNQDRCLIIIIIGNFFVAMLHGGWHAFFIPHAQSSGNSIYLTLCLLYSTSIACFIARIFSGILHCPPGPISGHDLFLIFRVVNIASMLVDIYFPKFTVMIVTSFLTSFAINEENMFMIFISKERSPRSSFPHVFAVIQIAFGIGALVGTYLTGLISSIVGGYKASFLFLVSVEIAILLIMTPPRFIKSRFPEERPQKRHDYIVERKEN